MKVKYKTGNIYKREYHGVREIKIRIVFLLLCIFVLSSCYKTHDSIIISKYEANKQISQSIADFMLNSSYESIYISLSNWNGTTMYTGLQTKEVEIANSEIIQNIYMLQNAGCEVILKQNSAIYFQYKSNLNVGYGVLYSNNENFKQNEQLKKVRSIEDQWYYYEEY